MQLRHVEYFVATAEAGTVSAAAVRVHVTQPSMSRQLRQLEAELGVDLFVRDTSRLRLSRTGQALLPAARALLQSARSLQDAAAFYSSGRIEHLVIAAPTVTLTDIVSPFVATMSPNDPVVEVRTGDGQTTAEMLDAGADLAIGTRRPPSHYEARELAVLPVWAYVSPDDPWAKRLAVDLADLVTRPLIGLPSTAHAREALDHAVAAQGRSYASFLEATNGTVAQALAASGRGVAVVSDDRRFDLHPLAIKHGEEALRFRLYVAWRPDSVAVSTIAGTAERLKIWVSRRYPN
ncbi:LysR family transcriptional regulator [Nocardioides sp. KIGAM211]|uniref:LysR family transcriptional regulator n=1 Tax=Nocardioides luti TaxID=2761101 RepID=A0A7X0RG53_9ACTN|nr:LysR family transcriptional regulator [Nocardioides luti]MBB6627602.1 LysR family transcriptional regulator [Nocardioides luti]